MSLVVQIEVKRDDVDVNSTGEKLLYGRDSEAAFEARLDSAVSYNSKKPLLVDEFKSTIGFVARSFALLSLTTYVLVALPAKMSPKHNLLFTFFHVNVKKSGEATRAPIAYAFLPLLDRDGKLVGGTRGKKNVATVAVSLLSFC